MQTIFAASPAVTLPDMPTASQQAIETADLLRQIIDIQREQLMLARQAAMNNDVLARWRRFLDKWQGEFPEIADTCKTVLPAMERVYLKMIRELTERIDGENLDDLDNEFALSEFLDKYGVRLNQLGTIIGQLSPIADAAALPSGQSAGGDGPKS